MSLSWRNRISVFLSPHRVELVRLQRRVKPGRAERQVAACERAGERSAWGAALAQLKRMLPTGTGADIDILLSNHFVRYAAIPPQSKIETPAELQAYAAFQMREIYGERATEWELSISSWDPVTGGCLRSGRTELSAGTGRTRYQPADEAQIRRALFYERIRSLAQPFRQWACMVRAGRNRKALPGAAGRGRLVANSEPENTGRCGRGTPCRARA